MVIHLVDAFQAQLGAKQHLRGCNIGYYRGRGVGLRHIFHEPEGGVNTFLQGC